MQASQTFLITGGAGFIGTNLSEHLVKEGHSVLIVDNLCAGDYQSRIPKEAKFHKVDVRDTAKLTELCDGVDVIVHLAALPEVQFSIDDPVATHDVNINGTLSVLEAAKSSGVKRIVYAATSAVYGDQEKLPLSLDLPAQPKSPYALQKYMGEEMMKLWSDLYDIETVSLRFFNIYGPHFDPEGPYASVMGKFLAWSKAGEPLMITGDGEQTRDFVNVSDVVKAIIKASQVSSVGKGEVFNVGSGKNISVNELADMVGGVTKHVAARHEPSHSLADITETKKILGWEPEIELEDGIQKLKSELKLT